MMNDFPSVPDRFTDDREDSTQTDEPEPEFAEGEIEDLERCLRGLAEIAHSMEGNE